MHLLQPTDRTCHFLIIVHNSSPPDIYVARPASKDRPNDVCTLTAPAHTPPLSSPSISCPHRRQHPGREEPRATALNASSRPPTPSPISKHPPYTPCEARAGWVAGVFRHYQCAGRPNRRFAHAILPHPRHPYQRHLPVLITLFTLHDDVPNAYRYWCRRHRR